MKAAPASRVPGVHYARGFGGLELPVIDVTHPAFAPPGPAELQSATAAFDQQERREKRTPPFLRKLMFRVILGRSVIGRGLLASRGTFLKALPTYMLKLGPGNLGPNGNAVDRSIAESLPAVAMRMRLHDMALLMAEGLVPLLRASPSRPLRLINIAGGATADSLNALLLLRRDEPALLEGRAVRITVLDAEDEAPAFGAAALEALKAPGSPLHGLDVTHEHLPYDWRNTALLTRLSPGDAVVVGSSEGGLFDYGTDEEIVSNLRAFREAMPADAFLAGTVSRADGIAVRINADNRAAIRPRTLEAFTLLATRGGYAIDRVLENPMTRDVRLRRG